MIERYRHWYEHEKHANAAMLTMIESVPLEKRGDPMFQRAVTLAAHLAACRENWLTFMTGDEAGITPWFDGSARLETLRDRFGAVEERWTRYLASLDDETLVEDFDFVEGDGNTYRWNIEGQVFQLVGHAPYHRGQVALLVDLLGGETVDTDYVEWALPQDARWGLVTP